MANEKKLDGVILGLLSHQDKTGYEVKERVDSTLRRFWGASFGSIYPTLKELVSNEVATKVESVDHGRKKLTYSITEKGRQHLKLWLMRPVEKDEIRYETLLKLFFGESTGPAVTGLHIAGFESRIKAEIPFLEASIAELTTILDVDAAHLFYLLTAKFGLKVFSAYLEWAAETKEILAAHGLASTGEDEKATSH